MERTDKPYDIVDVVESYGIYLKQQGAERVAICPFHNDHHMSLKVNRDKQIFKCFSCGASGNYYAFQKLMGDRPTILKKVPVKEKRTFNQIIPVGSVDESPGFEHYKYGLPDKIYPYLGVNKELLGYTCRYNLQDGKQVLPYIYGTDGKRHSWRYAGFKEPRPLYGLQRLKAASTVLIVEGEKANDFASARLEDVAVLSWIGGALAVKKTKWDLLKDKRVLLWPDNDSPGLGAMIEIASILSATNRVEFIRPPENAPEHWDVADSGWTSEELKEYINNNRYDNK